MCTTTHRQLGKQIATGLLHSLHHEPEQQARGCQGSAHFGGTDTCSAWRARTYRKQLGVSCTTQARIWDFAISSHELHALGGDGGCTPLQARVHARAVCSNHQGCSPAGTLRHVLQGVETRIVNHPLHLLHRTQRKTTSSIQGRATTQRHTCKRKPSTTAPQDGVPQSRSTGSSLQER